MATQRTLAPAVTPRPVKAAASPTARGGRTYVPSAAAAKTSDGALRPPEATLTLRKKPLVLSGDIRNLDSNFALALSRAPVSTREVQRVFLALGLPISNDAAQALVHEYEETNDRGVAYAVFVDELLALVRQHKHGLPSTRLQHKRAQLPAHLELLATMHARRLDELSEALSASLRVGWSHVRDAFRRVDASKSGRVSKAQFREICARLDVPGAVSVVDTFVAADGESVDYAAFLAEFGAAFQHGDTNSVGFSLVYRRHVELEDAKEESASTNHSLQSPGVTHVLHGKPKSPPRARQVAVAKASDPVALEKLRILLNDKIAARHSDVKKAFMALDRDGNGIISAAEFDQVLRDFNLVVAKDELDALLAVFDTNQDGAIDYHEFFAKFGDVMKPSAALLKKKHLLENSSLVFGGERDIKGANKNRLALSSPGNELKEAFSRLPDDVWRAIYVELDLSDVKKTGVVPSAEMLRVLTKYLGELPKQHYASLFRACGSHVNQLMNYRQLVKSYRQSVMDPIDYFHQDTHALTDKTYRKSPTESLVMVWSIRVQRAQMPPLEWVALKEDLWRADARRVGRILAAPFMAIVKNRMKLTEDQAAFLSFFYEDKNLSADQVTIRYGSFLTDFEDSGLEEVNPGALSAVSPQKKEKTEGKGRVRPPGYGIHNSHHHGAPNPGPAAESVERDEDEKRLRQFFAVNIRSLEAQLQDADPEKRGFVSLDTFTTLCRELNGGKFKDTSKAFIALVAKYIAQNHFYYRGFLLDFDARVGLQAQALVVQDDDDEDEENGEDGDVFDEGGNSAKPVDVHQAKEALRHHLTVSLSRQKVVYKLMQRMDPGKSGLLGYAELRRAFERLDISIDDDVARELCGQFEEEDETTGARTGRVKYLMLLHAHGGRDPDKLDGMSDISSNCSYYSAISISPRAVMKNSCSRLPASRDQHAVAARAVNNAIERPRSLTSSGLTGAAAAAAVERKIQSQLETQGKKGKWKQISRAFQQIDSDRRGSVSATSFRKVMEDAGVHLDAEDVVRLQLKYDIEQNGKLNYHEFLRHLTNAMSELSQTSANNEETSAATTLPTISSPSPRRSKLTGGGGPSPSTTGMAETLRQGVKAKWKAIYASLKTLDKGNIGRVSAAHFRQLLEWYALTVTDDEFLQLLRLFDHDDDGGVDYNKFMKACFA